jgi:protoporphyrin/coproporphyrin ferrochelatase
MSARAKSDNIDALLLLSFGGPEGPDQVMPFLENVTRGRGIPRERLAAVAEHYLHFDGVSPINGINRALIDQLRGLIDIPVYFGNRNWEPYIEDAVTAMAADGIRRAAVFATSAWGGYSGCTQYVEDIARARRAAGDAAPQLVKLRQFYDHPLFVAMFSDAITAAAQGVPDNARLVFTAHSIPLSARSRCGPELYRGWSPTSPIISLRSPGQAPTRRSSVRSASWPTTSRWSGISTTN